MTFNPANDAAEQAARHVEVQRGGLRITLANLPFVERAFRLCK